MALDVVDVGHLAPRHRAGGTESRPIGIADRQIPHRAVGKLRFRAGIIDRAEDAAGGELIQRAVPVKAVVVDGGLPGALEAADEADLAEGEVIGTVDTGRFGLGTGELHEVALAAAVNGSGVKQAVEIGSAANEVLRGVVAVVAQALPEADRLNRELGGIECVRVGDSPDGVFVANDIAARGRDDLDAIALVRAEDAVGSEADVIILHRDAGSLEGERRIGRAHEGKTFDHRIIRAGREGQTGIPRKIDGDDRGGIVAGGGRAVDGHRLGEIGQWPGEVQGAGGGKGDGRAGVGIRGSDRLSQRTASIVVQVRYDIGPGGSRQRKGNEEKRREGKEPFHREQSKG